MSVSKTSKSKTQQSNRERVGKVMIEVPEKKESMVNHPSHYGGDTLYETIKVMANRLTEEEFIGAMKFNVYKYNDRAKKKGSEIENYQKAQFYQNYLVAFMTGGLL